MPGTELQKMLKVEPEVRKMSAPELGAQKSSITEPYFQKRLDLEGCRWSPEDKPMPKKKQAPSPLPKPATYRKNSDAGVSPGPSDEGESSDEDRTVRSRRKSVVDNVDNVWEEKMKASRGKFRGLGHGCSTLIGIQMTKGPTDEPGFGAGRGRPSRA
jgi:hypothetical protein